VAIWEETLGVEQVGIHDDFFDLGGQSLMATQMLSRLRATFPIELPLRSVFEATTIAKLAMVVEEMLIEKLEELPDEDEDDLI